MNRKALIEVGKSFLRFLWFGVLGLVVAFLTSLTTSADLINSTWTVFNVTVPIGVYIVAGIGFAVKALDRYIHKNPKIELQGLALPPMQSDSKKK